MLKIDQFTAANEAAIEQFSYFAKLSLANVEKFAELGLDAARESVDPRHQARPDARRRTRRERSHRHQLRRRRARAEARLRLLAHAPSRPPPRPATR